jgi:PhnB protein
MCKSKQPVPSGYEGVIPHLVCDPCCEAIEFYKKAFGAEEVQRISEPGGRIMHAEMRIGGARFFLVDDFKEYHDGQSQTPLGLKGTPVILHRFVADCDAAIDRARLAGATVKMSPQDMFWGDRYGIVTDPFGHQWSLASRVNDLTADQIQQATNAAFAQRA